MRSSRSVAFQAAISAILFVGFWVLAIALNLLFALIPILTIFALRDFPGIAFLVFIPIAAAFWPVAFVIAGSLFPKKLARLLFPELSPHSQSELFSLIREVAQTTQESMPHKVYLSLEVNASVSQRGGIFGLFSRRILTLGLPLLSGCSREQIKAVIAHEFGHYKNKDTALLPWLHHNFGGMFRLIENIQEAKNSGHQDMFMSGIWRFFHFVEWPLVVYGNFVLKTMRSMARVQEYQADSIAVSTTNQKALAEVLLLSGGLNTAFLVYWNNITPILRSGIKPSLVESWQTFLRSREGLQIVTEGVNAELARETAAAFDTHPTTRERLRAIDYSDTQLPALQPRNEAVKLHDLNDLEMRLLELSLNQLHFKRIKHVLADSN